jgi:hypothetical protein
MVDFAFPSQAEIRQGRRDGAIVDGRDAVEQAHKDKIAAALAILNQRQVEDADGLDRFTETMAEFFGCERLTERHMRARVQMIYRELRQLVADLGTVLPVSAETREPRRDSNGRFTSRR